MKKSLFISALVAFVMMFCVNVNAQEKATGKAYKDLKKQEKVLDKELQKKAIKEARKEAKKLEKDLAGQIQTKVSQLIEAKVANDDMGQEEAASLSSVVASSKSVISATLGRTIPLVEVYKTLPNKNVEVMVTIGYSMQSANQAAVQAIRKELAAKSEELAKQLDKLGY